MVNVFAVGLAALLTPFFLALLHENTLPGRLAGLDLGNRTVPRP